MKIHASNPITPLMRGVVLSVFVAVPVFLLSFFVMNGSTGKIMDETGEIARKQAMNVSQQITSVYDNYKQMCDILASSQELADYAVLPAGASEDTAILRGAALRKKLMALQSIYGKDINTVAVYFPESDTLITSARRVETEALDTFFGAYMTLSPEMLLSLERESTWVVRFKGETETRSWIVRPVRLYSSTIYTIIDYDVDSMVSRCSTSNVQVFLGDDQACWYSNADRPEESDFQRICQSVVRENRFSLERNTFVAYREEIVPMGMQVIVGVNMQDAIRPSVILRTAIAITILFFGTSTFIVAQYYKKNLILPVEYLRKRTNGHKDTSKMLYSLADDMQSLQKENVQMLRELEGIVPLMAGRLLNRLHEEHDPGRAMMLARSCLTISGIPQGGGYILFAITCADGGNGFLFESMQTDSPYRQNSVLHFTLDNVLRDLLYGEYPGIVAPINRNLYFVTVSCENPAEAGNITGAIRRLVDFFAAAYDATLAGTTPLWGNSAENYAASVEAAFKEAAHLEFWCLGEKRAQSLAASDSFSYYCRQVKKLINRLNVRDYEGSSEMLDYILENALPDGVDTTHIAKGRVYGIATILISIIDEQLGKNTTFSENLNNFESSLIRAKNIYEIRGEMSRILTEIIAQMQAEDSDDNGLERMERIRAYIDEHYMESDLNVNSLAQQFDISTSYLSRSFKRYTGTTLLEYIQQVRVSAAKQLLASGSVKDVAQKVGFWDAQGLVRTFKKYEGVVPSEYKRLLGEENNLV